MNFLTQDAAERNASGFCRDVHSGQNEHYIAQGTWNTS